jgi:hypothetical protein
MPIAYGKRLKLRLFLEGVEIPVIAANVQAAPNSPIVASIQIPPLAEGTRFLPRTLVHLFFLDETEARMPSFAEKRASTNNDPTAAQQVTPGEETARLTQYKLLFGGEIVGMVWNRASAQRALVLQCLDWSNYWDYAYQFNNTSIFGPGRKVLFSGGATNLFTDFLKTKGTVIAQIVSSGRCNAFPQLGGLAAGVIRLLEAIGGVYFPNPRAKTKRKKIAGMNLFFSIAELRLHVTHMIAAIEKDQTTMRMMRRYGWQGLFNRTIGGLGAQTSIRTALNALTRVIFHETYGQPCPLYVPGSDGSGTTQERVRLGESKEYAYLGKGAASLQKSAQKCLTLLPGAFGGYGSEWEEAVQEASTDESSWPANEVAQSKEKPMSTRAPADIRADIARTVSSISDGLWKLTTKAIAQKAPSKVQALLAQAGTHLSPFVQIPMLFSTQNIEEKITASNQEVIESALSSFIDVMSQISGVHAVGTVRAVPTPPRLNQQIFRPDIWFGAPIRCNVLFPDHYDSLSYQRTFLQEPTRFLLKTNDEFFGENFLFDKFYFAPQAPSITGQKARIQKLMHGDLMDHELFTGILPVFEKMGEFNVFAGNKGLTDAQKREYAKVGFAQRSANFIYFKHRYTARQLSVGGRFNPYIACGCPGLILDKYVDIETIKNYNALLKLSKAPTEDASKLLGTNFLANFTSVSHAISQAETIGRTDISCTYARQAEETTEFLGMENDETTVREKVGEPAKRVTEVAASSMPKIGSRGPNGGKIVNVIETTSNHAPGTELLLYGSKRGSNTKVPIGVPVSQTQSVETPIAPEFVPGESATMSTEPLIAPEYALPANATYRAYSIEETIQRYEVKAVKVPTEELLRPGWYGDVWTTSKIGEAYNTFFGTGAITDPQITHVGPLAEAAAAAAEEAATAEGASDPKKDAVAVTSLQEGATIQNAIDFLLLTYSYIRQNNLDVDAFASTYTWRPIATMADIFGTSDLKYSDDGSKVLSGVEGFHSKAFGPYNNLFGLADPEIKNILGIKKDDVAAQNADTRKRKQEAVLQYAAAISFSRGILG